MPAVKKKDATATGAACAEDITLLAARRLVYNFQQDRLNETYSDYEDATDIRHFFFQYVYADPAVRKKFAKRDAAFIRTARSRLFRIITTQELRDYLETVIELRDATDRLDMAVAKFVAEHNRPLPQGPLGRDGYARAYRAATTKTERIRQLEAVLRSYELCCRFIREIPFSLEDILRITPKIFLRNSELLNLCVTAYRIFSRHKPRLDEYGRVLRERETAYINRMFDGE